MSQSKIIKPIFYLLLVVVLIFFFLTSVNLLTSSYYSGKSFFPIRLIRAVLGIASIFFLLKFLKTIQQKPIKKPISLFSYLVIAFIVLETLFSFVPYYSQNHYSPLSRNWLQLFWHENSDQIRDYEMIEGFDESLPFLLILGDDNSLGMGINNIENRYVNIIRNELSDCYNVLFFGKLNSNSKSAYDIIQQLPFRPYTVIYIHSPDDIIGNTEHFEGLPEIQATKNSLERKSYLFDYLNEYQGKTYASFYKNLEEYYANDEFVELHKNKLGGLMHYTQFKTIRFGVVLLPEFKNKKYIKKSDEMTNQPLSEFITNNGTANLNLTETILKIPSRKRKTARFSKHPSKYANKKIAKAILNFMDEKSIISPSCIEE